MERQGELIREEVQLNLSCGQIQRQGGQKGPPFPIGIFPLDFFPKHSHTPMSF